MLGFNQALNPLESLRSFQKSVELPLPSRPTKTHTITQHGAYPVVHGTANDNLQEKWLLPEWGQYSSFNWRNP